MSAALARYLDRVLIYANRPADEATEIREELQDHLLEKIEHLETEGVSHEDAIFRAIDDHGAPHVVGYGLRPKFPLLDIRARGTARGVIAIGPKAVGIFAFGGITCGVFTCGGVSAGVVTLGGICVSLLFCWAGIGISGISYAGVALGLLASGGLACGVVATGATGIGIWVPAAAKSFSYYSPANVPPWLQAFDPIMIDHARQLTATYIALPVLLLMILIPNLLVHREIRRIRDCDKWLTE